MNNVKIQIEKAILVLKHDEADCGCACCYGGWYYHCYDTRYIDKRGMAYIRAVARRVAKVFRRSKDGKFVHPSSVRATARMRLARLIAGEVDKGVFDFVDNF